MYNLGMSHKKRNVLIALYCSLVLVTLAVCLLAAHDNQVALPSEGWRPTPLLRAFNSDTVCAENGYSMLLSGCLAAYDKESLLVFVLVVATVVSSVAWIIYLGMRWHKKSHRS